MYLVIINNNRYIIVKRMETANLSRKAITIADTQTAQVKIQRYMTVSFSFT
jgi:hypothetical protein